MRKLLSIILTVIAIGLLHIALADNDCLQIEPFSEGLAAVQNSEHLWGYIDKTGTIVIPCEWEEALEFKNGIARIRKDWKYGWINKSGQTVIDCVWKDSADCFSEGLAAVQNENGLWGFIDPTGTVVLPFEWNGIMIPRFSDGLAAVEKDNAMGYINKAGEEIIPCQYEFCNVFSHGYALVKDDSGLYFIDTTGAAAFPEFPHAVLADSFREDGIAYLGYEDHTGYFINTDGQIVCTLSSEYRLRSNFQDGLAGIAEFGGDDPCEGYIDQSGSVVIPLKTYSSQGKFRNGRVCIPDKLITEKNVHYGVIDSSGALIYSFTLDKIVDFTDSVAAAVQDGRYGAINKEGNVVIPFDYDDVKIGDGTILCLKDGNIRLFAY